MQDSGWTVSGRRMLVLFASLLAIAAGCGDDDSSSDDDDGGATMGERCESPGFSMTGCVCTASQPPGSRTCRSNGTWSGCVCPPGRRDGGSAPCREGQLVRCNLCPGETMQRETRCLASGTFDCSCMGGMNTETDAGARRDAG